MSDHDPIYEFSLGQAGAFVIPAEVLGAEGIAPEFQMAMRDERGVSADWIGLFNAAFGLFWRRTEHLARRAPRFWMPPRVQNTLIAGSDEPVLPFSQPFYRASWTLFDSDFDPDVSNVEFASYLILHQERMAQTQQILSAFVQNLSYWLDRSDAEIAMFRGGAAKSSRPDAATFRVLADSMETIRGLHDVDLKPPPRGGKPMMQVPPTGLAATQSQIEKLQRIGHDIGQAAEATISAFGRRYRGTTSEGFELLCRWLDAERPKAIVTGKPDEILWSPDGDADSALFREIAGTISTPVAESMIADLAVVGDCTSRFLASLRRADQLPPAHDEMEQRGLSYIHVRRNLVAYSLTDPAGNRLGAPSPTFDRLMLAARTIHEWGHQAVDAGWVPIADEHADAFASSNGELAALFDEIVTNAPAPMRGAARSDLGELSRASGQIGRSLAAYAQSRMPDFQANLLSQHFLTRAQAEAYVRNNVYCLVGVYPPAQVFRQLARYAYEYQYLRFSGMADRDRYFRSTTWFDRQFVASGFVTDDRVRALFRLMASICDCYAVDATAFDFEAARPH
ncbi:MAG: hypothetical protein H6819_05545 [Phycisphaerales bacterium]|nr:hypothetical protein [Phycisphaerales bacterium]MCB9854756.1 hypothetical protein [Phycisphaerales bacterium]MCB9863772.1 hypothetical protein [Phycisphaerales bacterium]